MNQSPSPDLPVKMGFERDEVPSRVQGSALVGPGKAQKPCMQFFSRRLKRAHPTPQGAPAWVSKGTKSLRGCRAAPCRVKGSALAYPGVARKPTRNFRQRRKSATNQHNNASPSAHPPCAFGYGMKITCLGEEIPLLQFHFYAIMHLSYARLLPCLRKELN